MNVAICGAIIPENRRIRYQQYWDTNNAKSKAGKQGLAMIEEAIMNSQASAIGIPDVEPNHHNGNETPDSITISSAPKKRGRYSVPLPTGQPSIHVAMKNNNYQPGDIRRSNNARLEMAIADLFVCENFPDRAVESQRFRNVIKLARLTGTDFKCPGRAKISGPLLTINYENKHQQNKAALTKQALLFGLTILGDGATIGRTPLTNVLGLSADTPPTVVAIDDASDHMASGGKKNAEYMAQVFAERVELYDPDKLFTDLFLFDGAGNMQKAGRVLTEKYPRAYCLHGGEHVTSLFFSDIARLSEIKVCTRDCLFQSCL